MTASQETRGTVRPATERTATANAGNPGVLIGTQDVGGQPYARYRASQGTWVSASLREQGYAPLYGRETAYGAYAGLVRSPDGAPLANPDRVQPGQEYLVPVRRSAQPTAAQATPVQRAPAQPATQPAARPRTFELFADADASRGTGNRYGAGQPPSTPQIQEASAAPLLVPVARPALTALARAAAQWGGAEVVAGGAPLGAPLLPLVAAGAVAAGAVGWAAYEWYGVYNLWKSVEQGRAEARNLMLQVQQGVHRLWQNEIITDEEYFHYLSTGVLVVQPDSAGRVGASREKRAPSAEAKTATDNQWWRILQLGNAYNRARMFDYPFNEVYVEGPNGERYRVDAFAPFSEIVSRKFTQFASISIATGIRYVREMVEKYRPGTKIADVPSSEGVLKVASALSGRMILSVPVQRHPIPKEVLEEAKRLGVTIRDDFGNEFILDQPQPTYSVPPVYLKSVAPDAGFAPLPGGPPGGGSDPGYIELTEE